MVGPDDACAGFIACTRNAADVHGLSYMGTIARAAAPISSPRRRSMADITNTRKISRVFLRGQESIALPIKAKWAKRWGVRHLDVKQSAP